MDYSKHYSLLIERARNRKLEGYTEKHHVVPKCMGGSEQKENLVRLSPEEHFVAHQLLVKMHPNNPKLLYASVLMCSSSKFVHRKNNKLYGWIKRKHLVICKQRIGVKNGSFGTHWITNGVCDKKVKMTDIIPEGYAKGRKSRTNSQVSLCDICKKTLNSKKSRFCDEHRGRRKDTDPNEVLMMYESGAPMSEILKKFNWKVEQNVTSYLSKNFPDRKKFLPKKREIRW